jgi:MATE family multidrug resistance protein
MTTTDADDSHAATGARDELARLLRLALPIVVVQVGFVSMGIVDTMVVGRVSATALAGVALGHGFSFSIVAFSYGTLMILGALAAQAAGARDEAALRATLQRGLLLAGLLSIPTAAVFAFTGPMLRALGQPADVVPIATAFTHVLILGVPASLAFISLRQILQGLHHTRSVLIAVVVANVTNAALDIALVHGRFGAPRLGPVGAAWSTMSSQWVMLVLLVVADWRTLRPYLSRRTPALWDGAPLRRLLRLGAPIGAQYVLEIGTFNAIALFMGWIGSTEIAGHQIALQVASLAFMLPLGLSQAAAVRVGHAVGRGDAAGARRAGGLSLLCGIAIMTCSATVFVAVPALIARLFTSDATVVELAARLLVIAGVFQIFDGTQVVAIGILRGVGDTRTPMIVNLLGFILAGLPLALLLGFVAHAGAVGLWWGLVAGLGSVAMILVVRVRQRLSGDLTRISV